MYLNFCTTITPDYIHYALSLRESLLEFNKEVALYILVSEYKEGLKEKIESAFEDTFVIFQDEICTKNLGKALYDKYADAYPHGFRWSLKPILLMYLLQEKKVGKIIYIDSDVRFYSDYRFLFDDLDHSDVLLTPHWRTSDPYLDETHFIAMYTSGLYNAGFIAVNSKAFPALEWWGKANLFICEINAVKGQFADQTHLNLLPIYFDDVKSIKHRGCNVAGWNLFECKRTLESDGSVMINHTWPIVFIHFSSHTIISINDGDDALLKPHLEIYENRIKYFAEMIGITSTNQSVEPKVSQPSINPIKNLLNRFIAIGQR